MPAKAPKKKTKPGVARQTKKNQNKAKPKPEKRKKATVRASHRRQNPLKKGMELQQQQQQKRPPRPGDPFITR
ncbi:hypothetical protein [Burkholderia sp. Ac-20365]|uniref:hypothetical protein n=1 Tax=Burkholderia sp. Ac-20365 TaxID=2703897 RepID=UPI00197B54C2|nr:hypothetical protein [Burkholderia sp. Ac-20365]MBN3764013.1 hypothetical protein [Burkholderia sp. Ac-20365]